MERPGDGPAQQQCAVRVDGPERGRPRRAVRRCNQRRRVGPTSARDNRFSSNPTRRDRRLGNQGEEIELFDDALSEHVSDGKPDIAYELVWTGGNRERKAIHVVEE